MPKEKQQSLDCCIFLAKNLDFCYNKPMSKIYRLSFSILQKIMLVLVVHWFFVSIFYISEMSYWAYPIFGILLLGAYYYRKEVLKVYRYLMRHKLAIMLAVIIFQLIMIWAAELLVRRDAAVVLNGAFRLLKETSISSYITRNPNNLPLFLYERFFYKLFGESSALWIMQGLNMVYANLTALILYKGSQKFFNQKSADIVFSLYVLLAGFSPYFFSMYTDIPPLPFISLQIFLIFGIFKADSIKKLTALSISLGLLTGFLYFVRPTVMILLIAFFVTFFLQKQWKNFLLVLSIFVLTFGITYSGLHTAIKNQNEVTIIQKEGLAKGPLLFINLGLTYIGHNQADMKEGLLQYIEPSKRDDYNNGMFAKENVIKEIKRRLKEYTPATFWGHLYYKQSLTVAEGTLGWLYRDVENEKTPFINPLYEMTKNNPLAQFVRTFFLSIDKKEYVYYALIKQLVWIVMSLGLVMTLWKYRPDDRVNFLNLAVFGGLLFLQIFEGGKTRYLIQFLPQILLVSALGLSQYSQDLKKSRLWPKIFKNKVVEKE